MEISRKELIAKLKNIVNAMGEDWVLDARDSTITPHFRNKTNKIEILCLTKNYPQKDVGKIYFKGHFGKKFPSNMFSNVQKISVSFSRKSDSIAKDLLARGYTKYLAEFEKKMVLKKEQDIKKGKILILENLIKNMGYIKDMQELTLDRENDDLNVSLKLSSSKFSSVEIKYISHDALVKVAYFLSKLRA